MHRDGKRPMLHSVPVPSMKKSPRFPRVRHMIGRILCFNHLGQSCKARDEAMDDFLQGSLNDQVTGDLSQTETTIEGSPSQSSSKDLSSTEQLSDIYNLIEDLMEKYDNNIATKDTMKDSTDGSTNGTVKTAPIVKYNGDDSYRAQSPTTSLHSSSGNSIVSRSIYSLATTRSVLVFSDHDDSGPSSVREISHRRRNRPLYLPFGPPLTEGRCYMEGELDEDDHETIEDKLDFSYAEKTVLRRPSMGAEHNIVECGNRRKSTSRRKVYTIPVLEERSEPQKIENLHSFSKIEYCIVEL